MNDDKQRVTSTMIVPISDALRECLKDPGFLERLDGFIWQIREWREWHRGPDYCEDDKRGGYVEEAGVELVYGRDIWDIWNHEGDRPDDTSLAAAVEWLEQKAQLENPESEDPGSSSE